MSENLQVSINVEYCGTCGHLKQFVELAQKIKESVPEAKVSGIPGRQASFEVQVNDELVYSKLQTMAFPDFNEVTNMVKDVSEGKPVLKIQKQQPIDCIIS
ncbi:migration and invasion enhancer 1 [Copidosoma floridanum]|uniref:migration and invasion enhancer 1 n=1 Tax=Copidosoma floridanum TaxID=29053 RepID=UPI0006C95A0C|nr:migration and invasion enhancer 1 [Copidosoma floridanum]